MVNVLNKQASSTTMNSEQITNRVTEITKGINHMIYNLSFDENDFVTEHDVMKEYMIQLKFNRLNHDDNDIYEIAHLIRSIKKY